jgi:hypothetical protein
MKVPTRPHTLYIPDHLWELASVQARLSGTSTASVVVEAVSNHLGAQMDTPSAASPDHRPPAEPLTVTSGTTATADQGLGTITSATVNAPTYHSSQAELDQARGISLEKQQAAQKARDALLRGSRKEKA